MFSYFFTFKVKNLVIVDDTSLVICQDVWETMYNHTSKMVYTVIVSCIQFLVPVLLVFTLYVSIYFKLRNRPQVIKYFQGKPYYKLKFSICINNLSFTFQSMHAENAEKRRRTNVMISSIAVVFFVSWLPLNVFDLLMKLDPTVRYDMNINSICENTFIFDETYLLELLVCRMTKNESSQR